MLQARTSNVWRSCTQNVDSADLQADLGQVPDILKIGIEVPVYNRGGKDPNSHRRITITPVLAIVVETSFLLPIFELTCQRGEYLTLRKVFVLKPFFLN